jgi:L-ascorbate metabolism protein UlaG (beta-lactamase superfamily)
MTQNAQLYLRQNVQAEPLFNQWYAVSLIVPPATSAMFIANSHLKIMKSYTLSPELHVAANQDPAMMGGPFINYQENRVPEIKALLDKTITEHVHTLAFAEAIKALDQLLKREAKGYSLEPFYEKVPEILKGYIELVYDLNNHPSVRFIEKFLYASPYYNRSSQAIGLSLVNEDFRPFVLSTPRLESRDYLQLRIPFQDQRLDELFKTKETPKAFGEVKELLGFEDEYDGLFSAFLTVEAPVKDASRNYDGEGVRVRYFGHACLLIETKDVSILTDPFISYKYDDNGIPRYTFADLPDKIDYVLITHGHLDHIILEPLLQLRHRIRNIVVPRNGGGFLADPSLKLLLENVGFKRVIDVDELQTLEVEGGNIISLPFFGEHHDLNVRGKTAYLVSLAGKTICVAADSCNLETRLCQNIQKTFGDIDILFLGMECDGAPVSWFYGALLTKQLERDMDYSRQGSACNYRQAIEMATAFGCKQVYIYAMGLEPWLNYILSIKCDDESKQIVESKRFIADCQSRGIGAEMLYGQKEICL